MNKNLAGGHCGLACTFRGAESPLLLLICVLVILISKSRRRCFAADYRSVSGDGRNFRCCSVGELLRDCGCVSVMRAQEMCDEKDPGLDGARDRGAFIN